MARIYEQGGTPVYNHVALEVDTLAELDELETSYAPGSTCICIEDSSVWMLGEDGAWHEL